MRAPARGCGAVLAALLCGCSADPPAPFAVHLDADTHELSGWFSTRGEWILFAMRVPSSYSPLGLDEEQRCVTLVNGMGAARSEFAAWDGKRVAVTGSAVRYDALADGTSVADRLLSKKYFKQDLVENYCLRDWVFVVEGIQAASAGRGAR